MTSLYADLGVNKYHSKSKMHQAIPILPDEASSDHGLW